MERLLHYIWQHKIYDKINLYTVDEKKIEILNTGIHNIDEGPDFLNARIKIDNQEWFGNVEIHIKSSDWNRHGHNKDKNYNNVILHIVEKCDKEVYTQSGQCIPQVIMKVPENVVNNYNELMIEEKYPPCYKNVSNLSKIIVSSWFAKLGTERLQDKIERVNKYVKEFENDWERIFLLILARSFGFGINGDSFEEFGNIVSLKAANKHRDNLSQIEALFFGQAGLLEDEIIENYRLTQIKKDNYYQTLKKEYSFLKNKFSLKQMNGNTWKFLRMRPYNFPHIRIAQLASLYYDNKLNLSKIVEIDNIDDLKKILNTKASVYWNNHYSFGSESLSIEKKLSDTSLNLLIINAIVPILFAYGKHRANQDYMDKAFDLLSSIKPEVNRYTKIWKDLGIKMESAFDSQAIIQLHTRYCNRKDCLKCMFGYEYMKQVKKIKSIDLKNG